jgi:hypothetical protein
MALFSTAVDTCLYSFPIRRFLFRSTVAPLRCCQPKKLGASLAKLYSPKCVEGVFSEVEMLDPDRDLLWSGDVSRAAHHAYHELDRLLVAHTLRAHHRTPRLEVQGETYGTE